MPDQLLTQPDQSVIQKQRVEAASDFLSICAGTGRPALIDVLR